MLRSLQDQFLIAMPAMGDPNFNETVTYICKHDDDGALGIVINRPSGMSLGQVFKQLAIEPTDPTAAERPVLAGGPVRRDMGFVLHRSAQTYESTLETAGDIKVTVSPDIVAALARGEGPEPALFALGYAGWGAGQLEAEIAANAWLSAPADGAVLFEMPFEARWAAAIALLGIDTHQITSYAGHA